jgi:replicative DNA helicase
MQLYDTTLEQRFLSALIKYPQEYLGIQSLFSEDDLYSKDSPVHRTIFTLLRQSIEKGEEVDSIILAQRANNLGMKFDEFLPHGMSIADYIVALSQRSIAPNSVEKLAKELKKPSICRGIIAACDEVKEAIKSLPPSTSFTEIVETSDSIFNKKINHFEALGEDTQPVNLYDEMEYIIENAGQDKDDELMGPFPLVNKIYGSLVSGGNIVTITSRSGGGKSSLAMDYCCFVGDKYDVFVLHFDNGEMSKEELIFRRVSAITGVPHYLLQSGKWKYAGEEIVKKVRTALAKIKGGKSKFYYYCVAGMTVDEMVSLAQKFYYNKVGRGKRMILSFDYIKTTNQLNGNLTEWQVVGEIVDKFKKFIQKDVLFDGKPMIGMFTSVQSNRMGVTTNKSSDKIIDDESIVSLSDRIIQFSSHMFILRKKTIDEILDDGQEHGTHKLICIKARHLGEDVAGHLEPVKIEDSLRNNFINLEFKNFAIRECGDLREIARKKQSQANPKTNTDDEPIDF